jgi:hypothetical protein
MSPKHPHAAESGVGKHTTRESERAQACAAGKERVANAHPHKLAPEASKTSGAFFVFSSRDRALLPPCLPRERTRENVSARPACRERRAP